MGITIEAALTIHEYIMEKDLLSEVERITKEKWKGAGSRATYYNGLAKIRAGIETSLVEYLMWMEAEQIVLSHRKEAGQRAAA